MTKKELEEKLYCIERAVKTTRETEKSVMADVGEDTSREYARKAGLYDGVMRWIEEVLNGEFFSWRK